MNFWAPFPEIQQDLDRVRMVIDREISTPGGLVSEGLGDLARRDAKLLRPGFTVLAARIRNGGNPASEGVVHLAAAIEMLHMASLIHDDIVDNAATRRGQEALHVTHGSRLAVLLGDFLFARSFTLVAQHARSNNARVLSPSVARLVSAAIAEVNDDGQLDLSPRRYLHRIVGKTAILFALSFHVGAVESTPNGEDDRVVQTLRRIGYNLGVGFQIVDDLLDISGDPEKTGKPRGTDLRSGIITLPLIVALQQDRKNELSGLVREIRRGQGHVDRLLEQVKTRLEQSGALSATAAVAERYTHRANRELLRLPAGRDREILGSVAVQLLQRSA